MTFIKVIGKADATTTRQPDANDCSSSPLHTPNGSLSSLPPSSQEQATSSPRRCTPEQQTSPGCRQQGEEEEEQQQQQQPDYAYPSWLTETPCEAPPPASAGDSPPIAAPAAAAATAAAAEKDDHDDLGYVEMDEASLRRRQQLYESNSTNNNFMTSSGGASSSTNSVAQWFALETTAEDRLSCEIIQEELKDLISELFHFLKNRHWKKKLLTVLVVCASVLVMSDLMFSDHIRTWIDSFLLWMTDYPTAAEFVFVAIYVLATIMFIPPTLLLFGGGWAFAQAWNNIYKGVAAAVFACFLGSVIGALLSFIRARYMMRDLIELFAKRYPIVKAADSALKRDGLRIMFLLRLCPLIPFHGLNYLGGITGVSWETFLLSLIGILPYQIMIIIMGATAGMLHSAAVQAGATDNSANDYYGDYYYESQSDQGTPTDFGEQELQNLIMLIVTSIGIATLIIAMILAFRFTKKELQKELQIGEGDMRSYITTVRRMSMIDLYDSYRNDMLETDDGMEVIKAASMEFKLDQSAKRGSDFAMSSSTSFIAMESSRLDDD